MWTYKQKTGELIDSTGHVVARGYAGRGEGKNNPAMQSVSNTGPLCRGKYTIGRPYDSAKVGPYALPLTPDPENKMFGRSAFRIHGDSKSDPGNASHGCMIFPRDIRERVWDSDDHRLEVIW